MTPPQPLSRIALLFGAFIAILSPLTTALNAVTPAPEDTEYCVYCSTSDDCQAYANGAECLNGQCTDSQGLFGRTCSCDNDGECATGRCDGVFKQTCRMKLDIGAICNEDSDCFSGVCGNMFFCVAPDVDMEAKDRTNDDELIIITNTATPTATPIVGDPYANGVMTCLGCSRDNECGDGFCVENACTNAEGVHPPFCVKCDVDAECASGFYCDGDGLLSRTGKRCNGKKGDGAICNRRDECVSDHCNLLFRCESRTPESERESPIQNSANDVEIVDGGRSTTATLLWLSIALALSAFGLSTALFCRKKGTSHLFTSNKNNKKSDDTSRQKKADIEKGSNCQVCKEEKCNCSEKPLEAKTEEEEEDAMEEKTSTDSR